MPGFVASQLKLKQVHVIERAPEGQQTFDFAAKCQICCRQETRSERTSSRYTCTPCHFFVQTHGNKLADKTQVVPLREWLARTDHKLLKQIRDVELQDEHVIRGRVRMPKDVAKQINSLSGDSFGEVPWFIEPTHWPSLGEETPANLWILMEPGEDALAYVQKARTEANRNGLTLGNKQVAIGVAVTDARMTPIVCTWKLEEIPRNLSYENVEQQVFQDACFTDVELVAKTPRRHDPIISAVRTGKKQKLKDVF